MRIIVIGAGIFGITIALELSKKHKDITLVDMNNDIMQNASKVNHNRLHFGFHYPRSIATARQSLDGYMLFHNYFNNAITTDFDNYYMIEKNGNVNSDYYERFCDDLGLEYTSQYPSIDINFDNIESSYLTKEPIFDYDIIKDGLAHEINRSRVKLVLNKRISNKRDLEDYDVVINTTYFNINKINRVYGLEQMPLRMQVVVIPIFKYDIAKIGLTIMDGPFCSVMPKGFNPGTFLLYHAKESVIYETMDYEIPTLWYYGKRIIRNYFLRKMIYDKVVVKRNINTIVRESKGYFRFLDNCDFVDYWQTIRALPVNDDDERLSVFHVTEQGDQKIVSVLSGKVSTCLLIANEITELI